MSHREGRVGIGLLGDKAARAGGLRACSMDSMCQMRSSSASRPSCTVKVNSWWMVPRKSATLRAAARSGEPGSPTLKVCSLCCVSYAFVDSFRCLQGQPPQLTGLQRTTDVSFPVYIFTD